MDAPLRIGVVGLGASGVVTTLCLVRSLVARRIAGNRRFEVTVFERSGARPGGVAYGTDHPAHLLNMRVGTMSIDPDRPDAFAAWAAGAGASADTYVPRSTFRAYLAEELERAAGTAHGNGGSVRIRHANVTGVRPADRGVVLVHDGGSTRLDGVLLCPGESHHPPLPEVDGAPNYIASSWEHDRVRAVDPGAEVIVLGTGLSAIDVALLRRAEGHRGPTHLVSRARPLPKVQGPFRAHRLEFLTERNLRLLTDNGRRPLSLADVAVLFRLELQQAHGTIDWDTIMDPALDRGDPAERLAADIHEAETGATAWYSVLDATGAVIVDYWHHLDEASRRSFAHWRRHWMTYRHCMPLPTARRLLAGLRDGSLTVSTGLTGVRRDHDGRFGVTRGGATLHGDVLVDARGSHPDSAVAGPALVRRMLADGVARSHPHGGIDVDFGTSRLVAADGRTWPDVYLVGPQTSGVHFYTNSIETITRNARRAVAALVGHDAPLVAGVAARPA